MKVSPSLYKNVLDQDEREMLWESQEVVQPFCIKLENPLQGAHILPSMVNPLSCQDSGFH